MLKYSFVQSAEADITYSGKSRNIDPLLHFLAAMY